MKGHMSAAGRLRLNNRRISGLRWVKGRAALHSVSVCCLCSTAGCPGSLAEGCRNLGERAGCARGAWDLGGLHSLCQEAGINKEKGKRTGKDGGINTSKGTVTGVETESLWQELSLYLSQGQTAGWWAWWGQSLSRPQRWDGLWAVWKQEAVEE